MPIILQVENQVKHKLSPLDFQSTAFRNKFMGNHVQHFACVLSYEPNYLYVLWVPQGVIHSEMVVCFSNFNV